MKRLKFCVLLAAGILTVTTAVAAKSVDHDRVNTVLDSLQRSVNAHDYGVLEPRLDPSFTYQGREAGLSRMIMQQVVEGYPQPIDAISVQSVAPDGDGWRLDVLIEGPETSDQRSVRLSADYRLLQADIADIQLGGHGDQPANQASNTGGTPLPDSVQYPFEVHKGQTVVQASINGVSGNFLIDTGAQATVANTTHFSDEQLQTIELDHGRPSGVNGALTNVRAAPDLELEWGDLHLDNIRGLALDLSHLEASLGIDVVGLIGFNVLEQFEVHFDYDRGLLTLYRLDESNNPVNASLPAEPRATIPFELVGHIPVFPAKIGGQDVRLGVDSGAAEAMLAEEWEDPLAGEYEFVRVAEMRGANTSVRASTEVRFDSMAVSTITYEDVLFRFNDILLAGGGKPDMDGLLGHEFLSARPTSINFRKRELSIW